MYEVCPKSIESKAVFTKVVQKIFSFTKKEEP